jgi:signal transduction histidine kinase
MDLLASLKSSVEFSRPIAAERGVHLSFTSSVGCAQVYGNSGALQQLVLNLISNAVRHTQTGGRVSVSLSSAAGADGPVARVEFSDTGCGIAPELLEEIFVAGFSGSGTTSGLGLAVCRQIAQQHDARLSVKSRPGAGTTFLLEIPTL